MYKVVICDLDETLLKLDRTVDIADIKAIKECISRGIKFIPATGRGYMTVQETLKQLGLYQKKEEYVISFNGAAITENKDNNLLSYSGLSFDMVKELYSRGLNYDVCIHLYAKDMVYIYNLYQEELDYLANRMDITEIFTKDIEYLRNTNIAKMIFTNTNREYLQKIEKDLSDISSELDISYSSNRYMELNKKGVNKGNALLYISKLLHVDPSDIMAIGDNYNDLPMIKLAGLGAGVQNTVESMKEECDYISKGTCNEAAVSEILHKFILD